jgi:hypothetical protein
VSLGLIGINGDILSTRPLAIVDSGCDSTTFPLEWAAWLGINHLTDCLEVPCGTAGGSTTQYLYQPGIQALCMGRKFRLAAQFAPHCPHVLLGRIDFFRYFETVSFSQAKERMRLECVEDWAAATEAVVKGLQLQPIPEPASP